MSSTTPLQPAHNLSPRNILGELHAAGSRCSCPHRGAGPPAPTPFSPYGSLRPLPSCSSRTKQSTGSAGRVLTQPLPPARRAVPQSGPRPNGRAGPCRHNPPPSSSSSAHRKLITTRRASTEPTERAGSVLGGIIQHTHTAGDTQNHIPIPASVPGAERQTACPRAPYIAPRLSRDLEAAPPSGRGRDGAARQRGREFSSGVGGRFRFRAGARGRAHPREVGAGGGAGPGAAGRGGAGGAGPPVTARPRRAPGSPGGASAAPPAVSVRSRGRRAGGGVGVPRWGAARGAVVGGGAAAAAVRGESGLRGLAAAAPHGERGDGAELCSLGTAAGPGGRHGAVSGEGRGGGRGKGKGSAPWGGGHGTARAVGPGLGGVVWGRAGLRDPCGEVGVLRE